MIHMVFFNHFLGIINTSSLIIEVNIYKQFGTNLTSVRCFQGHINFQLGIEINVVFIANMNTILKII